MARTLPMFPLGSVLFPHMVLPLHVFEPRYRVLLHDVLDGDGEFGVVLITRGHEVGGGDLRSDVGTVARVVQAEETEDGRWLVIAVGTRRVRVERWLTDDPYPCAEVVELDEDDDGDPEGRLPELTATLRRVLALHLELGGDGVPPTAELSEDPAEAAWQAVVYAPIGPFDAQQVLVAERTSERLARVHAHLDDLETLLRLQLTPEAGTPEDLGGLEDPGGDGTL